MLETESFGKHPFPFPLHLWIAGDEHVWHKAASHCLQWLLTWSYQLDYNAYFYML